MDTMTPIQRWLANGERCAASDTIAAYCSGLEFRERPEDPIPQNIKDLRRCRLLLEQCPEMRHKLRRLAHLSQAWSEIVAFWDDLCLLQDLEDPSWRAKAGKARKTTIMLNTIVKRYYP